MNYRVLVVALLLFSFGSFISIAVGNIFLGIANLLFLIYYYKSELKVKEIYKQYQGYFKAIGIFLIAMLLSALFSGDIKLGLKEWADMWIWRMMPLVIILFAISSKKDANNILQAAVIGIFVGSLCAIYQGLNGDTRAAGFFGNPMTFAGWLCMFIPILFIDVIENKIFSKYKYISLLTFIVSMFALYYNGTRGAWLAVAVTLSGIGFYYMINNRKNMIIGCIIVMASAAGLSFNDHLVSRAATIVNFQHSSNTERFLMWNSALQMFNDHPILGVGLGQYEFEYQNNYISPLAKEKYLKHAHNNYMQMLGENGLVGFMVFVIMTGYIILSNIIKWYKNNDFYGFMISCCTVSLLIQGLTEYNFGSSAVIKVYWLVIGCLLVLSNNLVSKSGKDV